MKIQIKTITMSLNVEKNLSISPKPLLRWKIRTPRKISVVEAVSSGLNLWASLNHKKSSINTSQLKKRVLQMSHTTQNILILSIIRILPREKKEKLRAACKIWTQKSQLKDQSRKKGNLKRKNWWKVTIQTAWLLERRPDLHQSLNKQR